MRLRKTSQTTATLAQLADGYSQSNTAGYTCNYINNLNTYSTDEIRIGTWVTGKPLYRKTYIVTSISSHAFDISISNLNADEAMLDLAHSYFKFLNPSRYTPIVNLNISAGSVRDSKFI